MEKKNLFAMCSSHSGKRTWWRVTMTQRPKAGSFGKIMPNPPRPLSFLTISESPTAFAPKPVLRFWMRPYPARSKCIAARIRRLRFRGSIRRMAIALVAAHRAANVQSRRGFQWKRIRRTAGHCGPRLKRRSRLTRVSKPASGFARWSSTCGSRFRMCRSGRKAMFPARATAPSLL